jgi:hypothetical protein
MENEITDANKAVLIVTLLEIKGFATEAIKIGTALDRISKEIKL